MKMTIRERILLIALGIIVLLAGVYYLVFIPQMNNLKDLKEESQRLELEVEKTKAELATIHKLDKEIEALNTEVEEISKRFYPVILQDKLILEVDKIISRTGIKATSSNFGEVILMPIDQRQEKPESTYPVKELVKEYNELDKENDNESEAKASESSDNEQNPSSLQSQQEQHFFECMSITMDVEGSYYETMAFIKALEDFNRTTVVKELSLSSNLETEGQGEVKGLLRIEFCALPKIHEQDQEYFNWPLEDIYGKENPFRR